MQLLQRRYNHHCHHPHRELVVMLLSALTWHLNSSCQAFHRHQYRWLQGRVGRHLKLGSTLRFVLELPREPTHRDSRLRRYLGWRRGQRESI